MERCLIHTCIALGARGVSCQCASVARMPCPCQVVSEATACLLSVQAGFITCPQPVVCASCLDPERLCAGASLQRRHKHDVACYAARRLLAWSAAEDVRPCSFSVCNDGAQCQRHCRHKLSIHLASVMAALQCTNRLPVPCSYRHWHVLALQSCRHLTLLPSWRRNLWLSEAHICALICAVPKA